MKDKYPVLSLENCSEPRSNEREGRTRRLHLKVKIKPFYFYPEFQCISFLFFLLVLQAAFWLIRKDPRCELKVIMNNDGKEIF